MKGQDNRKYAIYSRKSKFTGKGESIGNQIDLCREYIRTHYGDAAAEHAVVFEDEGCRIPEGEQAKFDTLPAAYSHLYLCIDGELAAVICIHDPLRREAREAVRALHESGFTNVVMMTGDNRRTAETVAAEVGVDAVYAQVLPEDKAAFIRQEKAKGHTVIMVGDGVNDSPALSEADAGIAISTGAAIAREIADITVASEDLFALVTLRRLGEALMERIHGLHPDADRAGRGGCTATCHLGTAAQRVHPGHQPAEYDRPAGR